MRAERKRIELASFLVIFAIAIFIRFLNLGKLPFGDVEAATALQALRLSQGSALQPAGNVLLTNLMAAWMFLFGNEAWGARFFSALAGSLLVMLPFIFKKHFNQRVLIVISFWLAIDPGFVAMSRQINSTGLAILLSGLAYLAFLEQKSIWLGILSGLLLLSGSSFWFGLIPIALAFAITYLRKSTGGAARIEPVRVFDWLNRPKFVIAFLLTLVLAGTFGFIFLSQFNGIISAILSLFSQPSIENQLSFRSIIRMLLLYQFPLLFFGLTGLFTIRKQSATLFQFLVFWLFFVVIALLLVPAKAIPYVLWLELPLVIAAASFLVRGFNIAEEDLHSIALIGGIGIAVFGFLILISNNLFTGIINTSQSPVSKEFLIIAGIVMVLIAIFLIGWSLSWRVAGKSLLIVAVFYSLLFTVSAAWNASGLRLPYQNEMWTLSQIPKDSDLLIKTISEYSLWNHGNAFAAEILVVSFDSPSLEWELRDFNNVNFVNHFSSASNPELIITPANQQIEMLQSYRGEGFSYFSGPNWTVLIPSEWRKWVLTRQIPANMVDRTDIILWVRNDLFPGT